VYKFLKQFFTCLPPLGSAAWCEPHPPPRPHPSRYATTFVTAYQCTVACRNVNNDMMEMLIMAYAFKTSSARRIIGVIPYLPYSKQSKMRKRGCIVAKLLAQMISNSGK